MLLLYGRCNAVYVAVLQLIDAMQFMAHKWNGQGALGVLVGSSLMAPMAPMAPMARYAMARNGKCWYNMLQQVGA
jgi:hypothetical protein